MARRQKFVLIFPMSKRDPKHDALRDDSEARGSYLDYLVELADRLLQRRVDDDGSQAA